jgi:gamma-glutamyltranspeptidase
LRTFGARLSWASVHPVGPDAHEVAPRTKALGHANVVVADAKDSMTAASDPRSDGAAVVAHYPRITNS